MKQYAVFNINGDQIIGSVGDTLELAKQEVEEGVTIKVDNVLLIGHLADKVNKKTADQDSEASSDTATSSDQNSASVADVIIGQPSIAGASVELKIEKHDKEKKIRIVKFRRRQDSKRLYGHRQQFTQATLTAINSPA